MKKSYVSAKFEFIGLLSRDVIAVSGLTYDLTTPGDEGDAFYYEDLFR